MLDSTCTEGRKGKSSRGHQRVTASFFYVYSNRVSSFLFCIKDSFTDAALLQRFGFRLPGKQLVCKAEM